MILTDNLIICARGYVRDLDINLPVEKGEVVCKRFVQPTRAMHESNRSTKSDQAIRICHLRWRVFSRPSPQNKKAEREGKKVNKCSINSSRAEFAYQVTCTLSPALHTSPAFGEIISGDHTSLLMRVSSCGTAIARTPSTAIRADTTAKTRRLTMLFVNDVRRDIIRAIKSSERM